MRKYEYSTRFKKDLKKAQKQTSPKRDMQALVEVMDILANDQPLPPEKRDHPLKRWMDWLSRMPRATGFSVNLQKR